MKHYLYKDKTLYMSDDKTALELLREPNDLSLFSNSKGLTSTSKYFVGDGPDTFEFFSDVNKAKEYKDMLIGYIFDAECNNSIFEADILPELYGPFHHKDIDEEAALRYWYDYIGKGWELPEVFEIEGVVDVDDDEELKNRINELRKMKEDKENEKIVSEIIVVPKHNNTDNVTYEDYDGIVFQDKNFFLLVNGKAYMEDFITKRGGIVKKSISKKVNYVICDPYWPATKALKTANKLKSEGHDIEIINLDEFWRRVNGYELQPTHRLKSFYSCLGWTVIQLI